MAPVGAFGGTTTKDFVNLKICGIRELSGTDKLVKVEIVEY